MQENEAGEQNVPEESGPLGAATKPDEDLKKTADAGRVRALLSIGAVAGLALAALGIFDNAPSGNAFPPEAAAIVNGTIIRSESYQRAVASVEQNARDPLSPDDRRHILKRLIEEELLVQRAVALGLDRTNPTVRNTLVSAMIEMIVSGVGQQEPTAAEVSAFYEENIDFFARTDRYWVRQLRFPIGTGERPDPTEAVALARAQSAAGRLRAGEKLTALSRELGAENPVLPLPDGYLPAAKLREYLGSTPAEHATKMQADEISDPIRGGSAWHVLQMVARTTYPPSELKTVLSQVRAEMRRRAGDESLRSYLDRLRAEATVEQVEIPES